MIIRAHQFHLFIADCAKNINSKSAYFSVSSETELNGNSSGTEVGISDTEDNKTDKENQAPCQKLCSPIDSSNAEFETTKTGQKSDNTKLNHAHKHVVVKLENAHSLAKALAVKIVMEALIEITLSPNRD